MIANAVFSMLSLCNICSLPLGCLLTAVAVALFSCFTKLLWPSSTGKAFFVFGQSNRKTLADEYEYVMQGKLYKISEGSKRDPKAYVFFSSSIVFIY